ncbi:RDD family protein [Lacihabitans sp. CS3-21]|uniref:RDD family protein n=1 Tax=Lacihabitans sp. CS3-21 TaxID=2487332 RepID=UPI0020CD3564|nr:RDD family protein [Lacihabitans sp. CS3-21]MCP9748187.1 RDD family protein [Lacihabitans sp. CS3-21]
METENYISKFWTRIWSLLTDCIVLGVIGFIFGMLLQDFLVSIGKYGLIFGLTITVLYQTILNSKIGNGQTIGKRIFNIQVLDTEGNLIGIDKSFLRSLILSFPYFIANLPIPGLPELGVLNIIKTLILSSIVLGVIVIYIFNKQTRQSLHDLIAGTYVATIFRYEEHFKLRKISKFPFYILGGLITLMICISIYVSTLRIPQLKTALDIHAKISKLDGIINAGVTNNTSNINGEITHSLQLNLSVQNIPNNEIENDKIVKETIQTVLKNVPKVDDFDFIKVTLIRGFDIGIASQNTSKSVSQSPNAWRELLK